MFIPAVSPARYKRPKVKAEPYTELHWPLWSALNASSALFVILLNPSNEYEEL
jgi:hypothetical protein